MNRLRFPVLLVVAVIPLAAQAQPYLYDHLYWDAKGTHWNQNLGISGLSYLGYINDTIRHAVAIGEDGGARYVYNRFPFDTTRQYTFPGTQVIRCNLNGDAFPDFVCFDPHAFRITVLFGSSRVDTFMKVFVIQGGPYGVLANAAIIVADVDSSGCDDVIISDRGYSTDASEVNDVGRIVWYKFGPHVDTVPTIEYGRSKSDFLPGALAKGRVRTANTRYLLALASARGIADTQAVFLYPMTRGFSLVATDTIQCLLDPSGYFNGGFACTNVFNDSIDDILIGDVTAVLAYRGGDTISPTPSFTFHRPFETSSSEWGAGIVRLEDICGFGYSSLLVTDPDASLGNQENGAIFLFNIGAGLKDKCVGYARGNEFEGMFGSTAIALGDVNGDGRADFMVGGDALDPNVSPPFHVGYVAVFLGDTEYATSAVRELGVTPTEFALQQNFPNPFTGSTAVTIDISRSTDARLTVYDAVGRAVVCPIAAHMSMGRYAVSVNAAGLPSGVYRYELTCGNTRISRFMTVLE